MILKSVFSNYYKLSKMGIVIFALLTAGLSYTLSLSDFSDFSLARFLWFVLAFYLICSGSFIVNQAQEYKRDQKMNRTKLRPIPSGKISVYQAYILGLAFLAFGHGLLFLIQPFSAGLAFLTVILYNGFYTLWWKKHIQYGAVLGAIPGAMPPVIGYSLSGSSVLESPCIYLFFLLFFWQMPHFWSLAIHYQEDYKKAGFPVLPVISGSQKTLYHIGLYVLAYLGLALMSPVFLTSGLMYLLVLIPLAVILLYQFHVYFLNPKRWLPFFLWVNASILVYFCVPVFDKWFFQFVIDRHQALAGL